MTLGISTIICLLVLILFAVCEVWCKVKDVQATLSWLIEKIGYMQGIIDMYADDEDEDEDESQNN